MLFLEQLVNGLTLGSLYALVALGYSMVYGILEMINFAHGEVFMVGGMAGYLVLRALREAGIGSPFWSVLLALLGGMAASAFLAVLLERVAYRPLRRAPRLAPLISAIGASIFLQNLVLRLTNAQPVFYPEVFPSGQVPGLPFRLSWIRLFLIVVTLATLAFLLLFIKRSRAGMAIRAVAENWEVAALLGIPADRVVSLTFLVGGALAGLAGVLWGLLFGQVDHFTGFLPGIKAFTAAVLGGIGNVTGTMLGGYVLGLAETLGVQWLPAAYKDVIAFALLILILVFRPTGILGELVRQRL